MNLMLKCVEQQHCLFITPRAVTDFAAALRALESLFLPASLRIFKAPDSIMDACTVKILMSLKQVLHD
jgi:hypothetical protein